MADPRILEAIYEAIEDVNEECSEERRIPRDLQSLLYGGAGPLNSLGLVRLVSALEERLDEKLGVAVSLADAKAFSCRNSPFHSVETLLGHVESVLAESGHRARVA